MNDNENRKLIDDYIVIVSRVVSVEKELATLRQRIEDHVHSNEAAWERNTAAHDKIMTRLEVSLRWQTRMKIVVGTAATILGAILMLIYHYAPWIWDALPKHGHTH